MRLVWALSLLVVLTGGAGGSSAEAGPGRARAWHAQPEGPWFLVQVGPSGASAPIGRAEAKELRALDDCEEEASLRGYGRGAPRDRFVSSCMKRKGFSLPPGRDGSAEREEEDRGWLQRYGQSP